MQTELRLSKLGNAMGVAVEGLDLRQPPDPKIQETLHQAQLDGLVLCIRGQQLDARQFSTVMSCFGTPHLDQTPPLHPDIPEVKIFSSDETKILDNGTRLVFGALWHTDGAYLPEPCSLTALYGITVPQHGGDTQFCNMYAVYETLPDDIKHQIEGLKAVHNHAGGGRSSPRPADVAAALAAKYPPVVHPLVRTHPETGRKALYLCGERMERIVGLEPEASAAMMETLFAHAAQPQFEYRHKWQAGDILIWDNRCTMHKANGDYPANERRHLYRVTLRGDVPF